MADTTIEWATKVWNVVRGCERVAPECQNCYAEKQAHRFSGKGQPYEGLTKLTSNGVRWTGEVKIIRSLLRLPLTWKTPERVFVNSMADLFHKDVPTWFIHDVLEMIEKCEQHTFLILTKRPENLIKFLEETGNHRDTINKLDNCWFGVSAGSQKTVDKFLPLLLQVPARNLFISCEPLLEQIDISRYLAISNPVTNIMQEYIYDSKIRWIIAGAESGKGKGVRPMSDDWVRSLRDQCKKFGVDFFYKQAMDEKKNKISLPVLDGRQWADFPSVEGRQCPLV